jgi:hypothetical protein
MCLGVRASISRNRGHALNRIAAKYLVRSVTARVRLFGVPILRPSRFSPGFEPLLSDIATFRYFSKPVLLSYVRSHCVARSKACGGLCARCFRILLIRTVYKMKLSRAWHSLTGRSVVDDFKWRGCRIIFSVSFFVFPVV